MEAFRNFLRDIWKHTEEGGPYASIVLVALHNLVTSSIDPEFNGHRRFLYCLPEVLQKLREAAVLKAAAPELDAAPPLASAAGVLGLGWHRLKNCSM